MARRTLRQHRRGRAGGCARPVQQRRHAADGLLARPLERRARRHRTTGTGRVQHAPRGARRPRGGELPPRRRSRRTPDGRESHRQRRRSVGHVHGEIGARVTGRAARTNQRLRHRAPASPGGRPHHQRGSDGRARATARLPGDPGDGPGTRGRDATARTRRRAAGHRRKPRARTTTAGLPASTPTATAATPSCLPSAKPRETTT